MVEAELGTKLQIGANCIVVPFVVAVIIKEVWPVSKRELQSITSESFLEFALHHIKHRLSQFDEGCHELPGARGEFAS